MVKKVEAVNFWQAREADVQKGTLRDLLLRNGYNTDWNVYSSMMSHSRRLLGSGGKFHYLLGKQVWPSAVIHGRQPVWSGKVPTRKDKEVEPSWLGNALIVNTVSDMRLSGVAIDKISQQMIIMAKAPRKYKESVSEITSLMTDVVKKERRECESIKLENITLMETVSTLQAEREATLASTVSRLFAAEMEKLTAPPAPVLEDA